MPSRTKRAAKPMLPVLPEWAASVRNAMEERGIGLREFARQLDINHSTLRKLIQGVSVTSPHVEAVSRALDLPFPGAPLSPVAQRMYDAAKRIEDIDPALLENFMQMLEHQTELIERSSGLRSRERDAPHKTKKE